MGGWGRAWSASAALVAIAISLTGCTTPPFWLATPEPAEPGWAPLRESVDPPVTTAGYTLVHDNSGAVSVLIPERWTAVSRSPVSNSSGSLTVMNVTASTDLAAYHDGWDAPGVSVSATNDMTISTQTFLDNLDTGIAPLCRRSSTGTYNDGLYVGTYLHYLNCGETSTDFLAAVVQDAEKTTTIVVTLQLPETEDADVVRTAIFTSFYADFG